MLAPTYKMNAVPLKEETPRESRRRVRFLELKRQNLKFLEDMKSETVIELYYEGSNKLFEAKTIGEIAYAKVLMGFVDNVIKSASPAIKSKYGLKIEDRDFFLKQIDFSSEAKFGDVYLENEDYLSALNHFDSALEALCDMETKTRQENMWLVDELFKNVYSALASTNKGLGNIDELFNNLTALSVYLKSDEDKSEIEFVKAALFQNEMKDYESAKLHYEKAFELGLKDAEAFTNYATLLTEPLFNDFSNIGEFLKHYETNEDLATALDIAEGVLNAALDIDSNSVRANALMSFVYELKSRSVDALVKQAKAYDLVNSIPKNDLTVSDIYLGWAVEIFLSDRMNVPEETKYKDIVSERGMPENMTFYDIFLS